MSKTTQDAAYYQWRKALDIGVLTIVRGPKHRTRGQVDIRKDVFVQPVARAPRHRADNDLKSVEL